VSRQASTADVLRASTAEALNSALTEALAADEPEQDWLCTGCLRPVANDRHRFRYDGKDEFAFINPDGIRFQIITFSQTRGCGQTGLPTLQNTWFPGHAWSFCHCAGCGQHLGWFYLGLHLFAGLIANRIVRAQHIRN
jgi:hypothetical protein